jgi:hypothetical protein
MITTILIFMFFRENLERKDDLIGSLRLSEGNLRAEVIELKKPHAVVVPDDQKQQSPATTRVAGHSYLNETVDLDGKIFDHCTFTNATLVYRGTGSGVTFLESKFLGTLIFRADHPAAQVAIDLMEFFKTLPNANEVSVVSRDTKTGNYKILSKQDLTNVHQKQTEPTNP